MSAPHILTLLLAFAYNVLAEYPAPQAVTGNTTVHDPSICKDQNGTYFLFSSDSGIEIRTSQNRKNWTYAGVMWPDGAPWTDPFAANGNLWAPDCTYLNGEFIVYYAASTTGSQHSAIFLAKSKTGMPGSFTNEGLVAQSSSQLDYNDIDPNLIIVDDSWYLSLGSFWTGIKEFPIDPSTGLLLQGNATSPTSIAERFVDNKAIEGNTIFQHDDFFYLFSSWDKCCLGVNSTYNIRVGRSKTVNGGYIDQDGVGLVNGGGTLVLESHDGIIGPGGEDVFKDNDDIILVYHYYTAAGNFLGLNKLDFSSGWPVVQPT